MLWPSIYQEWIFEDLPGYSYDQIRLGEYRAPVSDGNDWVKTRLLETVGVRSTVAYSSMDKGCAATAGPPLSSCKSIRVVQALNR